MKAPDEFSNALIISTYNSPSFLRLCLQAVERQTILPDEVLIADDGSSAPTAELIEEFTAHFPVRLTHIWQPDDGFRKTLILNKAIRATEADYIIFIDGDIITDRRFIADHLRFARRGCFVTGSRVRLSKDVTRAIMERGDLGLYPPGRGHRSGINGLHIAALTPLFARYKSKDGIYARGCNMAVWREDLEKVNGFNNAITGWGREDSELSLRLMNVGVRKRFLKFGGIEYHLYHPEFSRAMDARNCQIMEQARDRGTIRAVEGLAETNIAGV